MPKLVDPETRRQEVADAVFRVAIRDGLQHASLRKVADEARLNIGSVRHYFAGHRELMVFAMRSLIDRVSGRLLRRVEAMPDPAEMTPDERRTFAADLLEQLLPLDDARRAESTVWLEFTTTARTDPTLADLAREAGAGSQVLVRRVLSRHVEREDPPEGFDLEVEVVRLAALLDGLSLTAVLHPDLAPADRCRAVLRHHLEVMYPA